MPKWYHWKCWTFANDKWFLYNKANVSYIQCYYFILSKCLIMFTEYDSMVKSYIQMLHYLSPAPSPSCRTFCWHKDWTPDMQQFWMNHEWFGIRLDEYPHVLSVQLICKHNTDFTIFMKQFLKLGLRVLLGSLIQLTSSCSFYFLSEGLGRVLQFLSGGGAGVQVLLTHFNLQSKPR